MNHLSVCSSDSLIQVYCFFWLIMIVFLRRDGYNDFNTFYMQVSGIFFLFMLPYNFVYSSYAGVVFGFKVL